MNDSQQTDSSPQERPLSTIQVFGSVLAAGLGVQSREDKVRDFTRGRPLQFLLAGLLFTVLFIGALVTVVQLVS